MSKEMREQINKVKNWKPSLNESMEGEDGKKLKDVKLFENFMINEDILELNSFARKLYTFLKNKDVNVSLGKETSDKPHYNNTIFAKDKDGKFIDGGVSIDVINSFPGVNFSHKMHKDGSFISVTLRDYEGKGVDKLIEDFISQFKEIKVNSVSKNKKTGNVDRMSIVESE
jgi:hypothetical protein